jgi:chemotaxis protein MotB
LHAFSEACPCSWEHKLSSARSKTVYKFLVENGIAKERLICKGYANWEMLFPLASSEEEMAANRRVEVRVLEK